MWELLSQEERNESLIRILVHLIRVDNNIVEQELAYLFYVADNMQIDRRKILSFLQEDYTINEMLPTEEEDRMNILYHLLFTMNADANISEKEENTIYYLAFKLGFQEEMTRDFVDLMKRHDLASLPTNSMVNIIKKYSN